MNEYYEMALKEINATTAEQIREVAKYCIIDTLSCQRLMVKCNVINEYREVVSISFLSLYDAHYFAGGMKVCNLLGASTRQRGLLTSTISCEQTESESFLEAYVFPPIKGFKNKHPVTGLDFASFFKFNNQDFLIWFIQHNNIPEEKGLYADVLEYLSTKRNEMKKCLAPLKEKKEDMELVIASMNKGLSLPGVIEKELANVKGKKRVSLTKNLYHFINKVRHEFVVEYDSICFDYSCLDAKQYALKVYMNTFYGTAGDSKSPFFLQALAGSIISAGQKNIKLDADFVKIPPERCFQECDKAYDNSNGISKEKYWSRMVNVSMEVMEKLCDKVNDFLRKDNGSSYIKMAYEKVLFLVVFIGKKKYYSILHERKRIIDKSMRVNNTRTLHQIVEDVLKETIKDISQTDLNEIIKTAV
ncbi:DNA polymerase family B-domain-containing protein [Rhizophagus clarus]|uniref:DNA-directed DNA polymerase n=1 Tax=Rhizophagus clarus TaxID=94130 RepID=A0A8H3L0V7_9GLOM|nr:DNA polymerase family B-domain-containing protein [Rhizophagus clarus]